MPEFKPIIVAEFNPGSTEVDVYDEGHPDARYVMITTQVGSLHQQVNIDEPHIDALIAALQQAKQYFAQSPMDSEGQE